MRLKVIALALLCAATFGYVLAQGTADNTWGTCTVATDNTLHCSFYEYVTEQQSLAYFMFACTPPVFEASESRYRRDCAIDVEYFAITHNRGVRR